MIHNLYFVIYGMCIMFHTIMAWAFYRRDSADRLSHMMALLMAILAAECVKDLLIVENLDDLHENVWQILTAIDLIVVPLYTHILRELCRPGLLTWRRLAVSEVPFVALIVLFVATKYEPFYALLVAYAVAYGVVYAVWVTIEIPRYNRSLKERFSYQENINLEWLRYIMLSFFALLLLWTIDSISINLYIECGYLMGNLVLWMFICYFLYRHESVIEELNSAEPPYDAADVASQEVTDPDGCIADGGPDTASAHYMSERIRALFIDKEFFLNPKLKLSDVAKHIGTNRTYLSNYFNRESGCTFFDYVNDLRIDYACRLLTETDDTLDEIATNSGFNSLSTFRRAFVSRKHCTPNEYRLRAK